jgi:hypothetical protein
VASPAVSISRLTDFRVEFPHAPHGIQGRPSSRVLLRPHVEYPPDMSVAWLQRSTERLERSLRILSRAASKAASSDGINKGEIARAIDAAGKRAHFWGKAVADWPEQYEVADLLEIFSKVTEVRETIRKINWMVHKTQSPNGIVKNFVLRQFPPALNRLADQVRDAAKNFAAATASAPREMGIA